MPFDPYGINDYHDKVRAKIEAREPGYAQTFIGDVLVSYEACSFRGPVFSPPLGLYGQVPQATGIVETLILDVARTEGIASPRTFLRSRIERMVEDRLAFPVTYPSMRPQVRLLRSFYLDADSPGHGLLF